MGGFEDTAAIIARLDLVITVDTAVAHLAGAMNKPCWLLLPFRRCDWRWIRGRSDSPWYPTMRIFRQPARHDWATPVLQVQAALMDFTPPAASPPAYR
jgi:ADP-heptose:LPS heptosyltransferase